MTTFYGPIKFDETGKNTAKPMVLSQVLDGKYVVVAPTKWARDQGGHSAAGDELTPRAGMQPGPASGPG